MTVHLEQIDDAHQFRARSETGYEYTVTSDEELEGVSPMEMVALGLGSCSSVDILSILDKQRQRVDHYDVDVQAERADDEVPAVFRRLHVHYRVEGDVAPDKLRRAIELSLDKYCSVSRMLEQTATISYAFTVNGTDYDGHERAAQG
jgi:putative redox protein